MGLWLKQSTAADFLAGPFIDDTDGKTPEVALTILQAEVRLSKNGGNMVTKNEATALAHDELGMYTCKLDATDTNTLGTLQVTIWESGALIVYHEFMVVTANTYDSLISGSDVLTADLTQIGGVAQSATDLKDFADAGYDPATDKVQGVVLTDTTTTCTTTTTNTDLTAFAANYTAARAACLDELAAANIPTDLTNIAAAVNTVDNFVDTEITAIINAVAALNDIAAADVWTVAMEGAITAKQQMNIQTAALAGKSSGGGTATIKFRDQADTKDRISATVTAVGNRTAVVNDGA